MAATRSQRRGYQGVNKLRRTLRRIDPEITQEVRDLVESAGKKIASDIKSNSAHLVDSGDMIESIGYKVSRDGLSVVAGVEAEATKIILGAIKGTRKKSGKLTLATQRKIKTRMNVYKAIWHEFGTKGSSRHNIPPIHPQRMHQRAFDANAPGLKKKFSAAIEKALRGAANG